MSEVKAMPLVPDSSFFIFNCTASLTCLYRRGSLALEKVVGFLMWNFLSILCTNCWKAEVLTRLNGRLACTKNFVTSKSNFNWAFDLQSIFRNLLKGLSNHFAAVPEPGLFACDVPLLGVFAWDGPGVCECDDPGVSGVDSLLFLDGVESPKNKMKYLTKYFWNFGNVITILDE